MVLFKLIEIYTIKKIFPKILGVNCPPCPYVAPPMVKVVIIKNCWKTLLTIKIYIIETESRHVFSSQCLKQLIYKRGKL